MASGDTIARFTPLHNEPHASSPMTLDTRNQHPVLDADATLNEYAIFSDLMPRHYDGGGATTYVHAAFSTATSGSAVFAVSWERIGDAQQDIDADGFSTAACATVGADGTAGNVTNASVAFTSASMDGTVAGEGYRLMVQRVVADADDGATGDAELIFVEAKET